MMKIKTFKEGAASFYIVALSTMILMILAASFASVIISEVTRTSNDDLSQSAYDSALAGMEDAKIAFANYKRCVESGATAGKKVSDGVKVTCSDIIYWMKNPDCDMVAHILGRIGKFEEGEVLINDTVVTSGGKVKSDLNQAYTCVEMSDELGDYRATLNANNPERIVNVSLANVRASKIKRVRLKWYSRKENASYKFTNVAKVDGDWRVAFQPLSVKKESTPPTVELQLVQTAQNFKLSDFDVNDENKTDRATLYLVPTNDNTIASTKNAETYKGVYKSDENINRVSVSQVADTNNHQKNLPFLVYCPEESTDDYVCSADIMLPNPIPDSEGSSARNDDTFAFVVSLPYGQPETDFMLEFYCSDNTVCSSQDVVVDGQVTQQDSSKAKLSGIQVNIDSTGRANDLFRRIEARLESTHEAFGFPSYAIQLLSPSTSSRGVLRKNFDGQLITTEYNF